MLRSNSSQQKERGEKLVVDGHSINYTRSGRIFGMPDTTAVDSTFAGEVLFHATGFNSQAPYTWTVPNAHNIEYVSVVCVGGGGAGEMQHDGASGGGGALAYKNYIPVSPGTQIQVYVGGGGRNPNGSPNSSQYPGNPSYVRIAAVNYAVAGGGTGGYDNPTNSWANIPGGTWSASNADGGGNGGAGTDVNGTRMGGGGAGGYNAAGGSSGPAGYYPISGHPGQPQPGDGGGGAGGNSINNQNGTGGGGGTGIYGQGSNGVGQPVPNPTSQNWYETYAGGGSTAYNTGLNSYIATQSPINSIPAVSRPTNYWGDGPSPNPSIYQRYRNDSSPTVPGGQYQADGGFPGGGGGGGHNNSFAGSGAHGTVRIVYGFNGSLIPGNRRGFPTTNVDRSDAYSPNVNPAAIVFDEVNGTQLMY